MPDQYPPNDPGWNVQTAVPAVSLPKAAPRALDEYINSGVVAQRYKAGRYYLTSAPGAGATANNLGNGSIRVTPFLVTKPLSIDRLFVEVTTAGEATSVVRLGLYADDGEGQAADLIKDAGTVQGNTTGVKEVSFAAVALQPGLYWVAVAVQGAPTTQPTLRTIANASPVHIGQTTLPGGGASQLCDLDGRSIGTVGTGLPTPFSTSGIGGGVAARTGIRVAP